MNFHKERKYPEKFYPSPVYEESEYKILDDKYNHLQYINAGKGHATNPIIFHRYAGYHPFIKPDPPINVVAPLQQNRANPSETI